MCIICIEFDRKKDAWDALVMISKAEGEPCGIDQSHLDEISKKINKILTEEERLES